MSGLYVASNVTALGAQNVLSNNMSNFSNTLTRLSTGLRINSGKDDPAGLIASEMLKSDMVATSKAITNTQRANSVMGIADSALGQVNALLNDIRGLVNESANTGAMSAAQISANQLQIDASLDSIDRIARNTNFQGMKLLDGSLDFSTTGVDNKAISNLQVNAANFGTADSLDVKVNLIEGAKKGTLVYYGTGAGSDTVVRIGGSKGSELFKFGKGESTASMAAAINALSDSTGVTARVEGEAQRGSVTLSSAGANNDIVITANEKGLDAGNYTFRITKGTTNDARIVSDPTGNTPGVVEISLVGSFEQKFDNFAGMFNITTDARYGNANANQAASVNITRGNANSVQFLNAATAASGTAKSGASLTVLSANSAANDHTSMYNGWTIVVGGEGGTATGAIDQDNKTITFDAAASVTTGAIGTALQTATGANATAGTITLAGTLQAGDRITLGGGGAAGELLVTYKEGATVGEIQDLINNAPNVHASLVEGVNRDQLVKNLPAGSTFMQNANTAAVESPYTSSATSQTVIDLINSKLGDKFSAAALSGDTTGGRVTYQDASAVYGDFNNDNALRFTGMDDGPVVRMVTQDAAGKGIPNQKLSVQVIQPSEKDIANGIHTPILQINLATDASGNSITTAKDIADLFDRLSPEETLGVSAELLLPPGVDPNGRVWTTDVCDNENMTEGCGNVFGLGLVQPTGVPGCEPQMNDIILLGNNQQVVADNAVARLGSFAGTAAAPVAGDTNTITFTNSNTSALNGITFTFTTNESAEGFDADTGTLTVFVPNDLADADGTFINDAIKANWEGIRAFTGYAGTMDDAIAEAPTLGGNLNTAAGLRTEAANGTTYTIPASTGAAADANGTRGFGTGDPTMTITAKDAGTDMAGVKIYLEQDSSLTAYTNATATGIDPVDIKVEYKTLDDGSKILTIKANAANVSVDDLAAALNANETFNKNFSAEAFFTGTANTPAGTVGFSNDVNKIAGITTGGYRVDSGRGTNTSSGISMTGQSDSNERLILEAAEYGSDHFVNVGVVEGSFDTFCPLGEKMSKLAGTDAVATINGQKAAANGNTISTSQFAFDGSMDVSGMSVGQSTTFTVTGGGAVFQLGPDVVSTQQIRVGIPSVDTGSLGGPSGKLYQLKSGGNADMRTDTALADQIVQEAISAISTTRGRIGAIQRSTLDPNVQALQDTLEALTSAEADISNADFAQESSNMARYQILVQSSANVLAQANQLPQYAAMLVG